MSDMNEEEFSELEIVAEFYPSNPEAAQLVRESFADEEVLESSAFTGAEAIMVVFRATRRGLGKVIDFFVKHRGALKDATLKVGREEVVLSGYSSEELQRLLESGTIHKLLRELRKP